MRYVAFVALTEDGPAAVAGAHETSGILKLAQKARDAGVASINGKDVPIFGGCVFASDALLQGPTLEFRCQTPKQRAVAAKAAKEAAAKAAKEAAAKAAKEAAAKAEAETK